VPIGGAIDIAEGAPPPAPQGVTRIARIGGVLMQSTDGANYSPLSTAMIPSTPSGRLGGPGGVLDLSEGAVAVPRLGVTRIARIGGVLMQSVDGAIWAPLTALTSPTSPSTQGYGPGLAGIDLSEGQFSVSAPGVTRLARIGGVLATSTDGGAWTPLASLPPGAPFMWFDAQNVDGLGNSTMVDGQQVGTWVNLGSAGAGANAIQATAGLRPLFRKIATPGLIGNKSAVQSDGTQFMATAVLGAVVQPIVVAVVFRATSIASLCAIIDSNSGRDMISFTAGTGALNMYAGAGPVATGLTLANATWETLVATFNGASSFLRMNGTQGSTINAGTSSNTGAELFSALAGTSIVPGFIEEALFYSDGTSPAAIEAYIAAKIGATPQ